MAVFELVFQQDLNSALIHLSTFIWCRSVQCWGCWYHCL